MDPISIIEKYQKISLFVVYVTGLIITYLLDKDPSFVYIFFAIPPILGAIYSAYKLDK